MQEGIRRVLRKESRVGRRTHATALCFAQAFGTGHENWPASPRSCRGPTALCSLGAPHDSLGHDLKKSHTFGEDHATKQTGRLTLLVGFRSAIDRKSTRLNSSHANISYA